MINICKLRIRKNCVDLKTNEYILIINTNGNGVEWGG